MHVRGACFPREEDGDNPDKDISHKNGALKLLPLSAFERRLLCHMLFHTVPNQQIVGLIFGRNCTWIGERVRE